MSSDTDARGPLEPGIGPGDKVLWDHEYWTVRRVNRDATGEILSLNLDRPGVTTCVKPGDVVVLAYCPTVAAAAEQSPTPAELERIEAIFDRLAAPARQLAELFDKRAWVGQAEAADALDEIQEALLDLAHWQFKRSGQGELPL